MKTGKKVMTLVLHVMLHVPHAHLLMLAILVKEL